jgi:hypothetical protein
VNLAVGASCRIVSGVQPKRQKRRYVSKFTPANAQLATRHSFAGLRFTALGVPNLLEGDR